MIKLARNHWPTVVIVFGVFATWLATANLDTLPGWLRTTAPLIIALGSSRVTEYGIPGVKETPGVWSAESVEKLKTETDNNIK